MSLNSNTSGPSGPSTWLWIGLVCAASLALSRAFAVGVVGRVLAINAVALALLLVARRAASVLGHGATARARTSP